MPHLAIIKMKKAMIELFICYEGLSLYLWGHSHFSFTYIYKRDEIERD